MVSQFLHKKNEEIITQLEDAKLLRIFDYVKLFNNEQLNYNLKDVNIVQKAVHLNEEFHSCSISEGTRNTLVSGILLALQDNIFKASYQVTATSFELAELMLAAIKRVLTGAKVRKLDAMMGVYQGILNEPLVKEAKIKKKKKDVDTVTLIKELVMYLQKQVYPLMSYEDSGYDILGRFYTEFIRYAASKQKQGLVLTPSHVTELFCDLADLKGSDIIYDPCCGTGGFLIAAMKKMLSLAGNNILHKENIRKNQLLGVELRPEMFTFACSNMMLRGDGKSNLDCGDCFNTETSSRIKKLKPTVSFLNPPYDHGPADQLKFIENALEVVTPQNGKVVAIVQMSCAIKDSAEINVMRKKLLARHTLKAVISMPDELFYPVGVVTCIMVFDANTPNNGKKTWFGYLKDDGFLKRKSKGRIDVHGHWKDIKLKFINAYMNNEEIPGLSVKKAVNEKEEWCAEAYMETDYSKLTQAHFEEVIKKFAVFKTLGIMESPEEVDVNG